MSTLSPLVLDIITAAILLLTALICRRRGFVKILSGILALVLAFNLAGFLADATAPQISEKYVFTYIDSAVTEMQPEADTSTSFVDYGKFFEELGIPEGIVKSAVEDVSRALTQSITEPLSALSHSVAYKLTYSILFVIFFILSLIILTLLLKVLNLAAKIPGINFINKTLGLILGLVFGYVIIVILSSVLVNFGWYLTRSMVLDTFLLKNLLFLSPITLF